MSGKKKKGQIQARQIKTWTLSGWGQGGAEGKRTGKMRGWGRGGTPDQTQKNLLPDIILREATGGGKEKKTPTNI